MTMFLDISKLKLKADSYWDETVNVSLFTWNNVFSTTAQIAIKTKVNKIFENGPVSIIPFLEKHGLGILALQYLEIILHD